MKHSVIHEREDGVEERIVNEMTEQLIRVDVESGLSFEGDFFKMVGEWIEIQDGRGKKTFIRADRVAAITISRRE